MSRHALGRHLQEAKIREPVQLAGVDLGGLDAEAPVKVAGATPLRAGEGQRSWCRPSPRPPKPRGPTRPEARRGRGARYSPTATLHWHNASRSSTRERPGPKPEPRARFASRSGCARSAARQGEIGDLVVLVPLAPGARRSARRTSRTRRPRPAGSACPGGRVAKRRPFFDN